MKCDGNEIFCDRFIANFLESVRDKVFFTNGQYFLKT